MKYFFPTSVGDKIRTMNVDCLHDQRGVTLIELMVTIMIFGVIAMTAIPNMRDAARSYQLTSQAAFWQNALNYARSEASKRGSRVTICASSSGTACTAPLANLHQGWIMFVDTDNDGVRDAGEVILRTASAAAEYTYVLSGTSSSYISFVGNGMTKTIGNASWQGSIKICTQAGFMGRQVIVNLVGRSRIDNTDPGDDC